MSDIPRPHTSARRFGTFICFALLAIFAITAWLAVKDRCATVDETRHLVGAWVQTFAGDFRCDYDNPPIWKFYLALGQSEQDLALNRQSPDWDAMLGNENSGAGNYVVDTLFNTPGNNIDNILNPSRARMLALGCVLGVLIAAWAWKLRGPVAGMVAAAAFSLDPNFLGHSPLVDNDVATALAFFAVVLSIWLIFERATVPRIIAAGLILGAALVTKYSCIIAIPAMFGMLFCRAMMNEPWKVLGKSLAARSRRLPAAAGIGAVCMLIAWLGVWACYGFRFEMSADPARHFNEDSVMQMVRGAEMAHVPQSQLDSANWQPSMIARAGQWAMRHRILPEAWVAGNLYIYSYSRTRDAFLLGQTSPNGWWYYFPLAMLFKTPVCTLAALAIALIAWMKWNRRAIWNHKSKTPSPLHSPGVPGEGERSDRCHEGQSYSPLNFWVTAAAVAGPALYMAMAMASRYNIGLRHILPVYPFLFVFLGVVAAQAYEKHRRVGKWIITVLVLGLAIETFSAFPDFIAFFNFACGGERGGLKLLSDSNLDWGQDLTLLADWEMKHPDKAVDFLLFTGVDPLHYGIRPPVKDPLPASVLAVSATYLQGTYGDADFRAEMADLRERKPLAVLGGTIYLFEIGK